MKMFVVIYVIATGQVVGYIGPTPFKTIDECRQRVEELGFNKEPNVKFVCELRNSIPKIEVGMDG